MPVLQKRGLMWDDYTVPGGTYRENLHNTPGNPYLSDRHPGSKFKWNAPKTGTAAELEKTASIVKTEIVVPVAEVTSSA